MKRKTMHKHLFHNTLKCIETYWMRTKMLNIIMCNIGFELRELTQLTIEFCNMSFRMMLLCVSRRYFLFFVYFIFMNTSYKWAIIHFTTKIYIFFFYLFATTHNAWKINSIFATIKKNFRPDHLSEVVFVFLMHFSCHKL